MARSRARDAAPAGLMVIVGQEVRTRAGDLIAAFIERPIERDLPAAEAIAAIRDQQGLVGMPHPYDQFRSSLLRDALHESLMAIGRLDRGAQRAARRERERACRGCGARARPARRGRLGRPHGPRGRRGLQRASTVTPPHPLGCWPRCRRPSSSRAERPMSYASGRRSPKVSNASEGTVEAGPRSRHERPAAGPSTDGRWDRRTRTFGSHGGHPGDRSAGSGRRRCRRDDAARR